MSFRNIAWVLHKEVKSAENSIHTPSVNEVVGWTAVQREAPVRFRQSRNHPPDTRRKNIYPIRYGLNTEVNDAGSLFRSMRDVMTSAFHTIDSC